VTELRFIYWDANVFLSYLNKYQDRIQTLEAILDNVEKNKTDKIVTSIMSKVEVAWVAHEKLNRVLSSEEESIIDALWNDYSVIDLIDFHDEIALVARRVMRDSMTKGWKLRTNDAIHLASAMWVQSSEFNTYERRLKKYEELIGISIKEPSVIQPRLLTE